MLGKREKEIYDFLETPARLETLIAQFASQGKADNSIQYRRLRTILRRLIAKGLIAHSHNIFFRRKVQ